MSDFNELQSKVEDLDESRKNLASKLAVEKMKSKRSEQQLKDRIEQLSRKEEHLAKRKTELKSDLHESKKRFAQVDWELDEKRTQINALERKNANLEATISRMKGLREKCRQVSQESDQAAELNRSLSSKSVENSPKPALKRQNAMNAMKLLIP